MSRLSLLVLALALAAAACSLDNDPTISAPTTPGAEDGPGVVPTTLRTTTTIPATTTPPTIPPGDRATVLRALDGDSLLVELDGVEEEVRLIGVNAPEADECYGDVARENLDSRVVGSEAILATDPAGEDRDRFGRLLRYVFAGQIDVNRTLLANGQAVSLSTGHSRQEEFRSVEAAAFEAGAGLWGSSPCGGEGVPQRAVVVGEIQADPPGRDDDALADEWVEIRNEGELVASMGGWTLRDESSTNRYTFPDGFELAPGAAVRVRTGCGTDGPADLYWCAAEPVWNNGGDTVLLLNGESTVLDRVPYP